MTKFREKKIKVTVKDSDLFNQWYSKGLQPLFDENEKLISIGYDSYGVGKIIVTLYYSRND